MPLHISNVHLSHGADDQSPRRPHVMETTNLLSKASSVIVGTPHGYDFHRKELCAIAYFLNTHGPGEIA